MPSASLTYLLLVLAGILAAARAAGHVAARLGQPAVLGELIAGVLLGNLPLIGIHALEPALGDATLAGLAELGVLLLLFQAGLESTVRDMLRVGGVATLVALAGVIAPMALGWGVAAWLLPTHSSYAHAYLGATLTATSVGITARVLHDLGASRSREARVILGAAVIDDVLGLIILAIVTGAIAAAGRGESLTWAPIGSLVIKAAAFLVGAAVFGLLLSPALFRLAARVRGQGVLLVTGLVICFAFSAIAGLAGLAPIVGAYAAGLILEDVHWREFRERGEPGLPELVKPVAALLVPVFFVLMGMHVDLSAFANLRTLALAGGLTVAAVLGKQACALGAWGRGLDARSIAIGMMPRGEVGLVFAGLGLTLTLGSERILDPGVFSAVVIVVIVTTLATPPALKWSLAGNRSPATSRGMPV